ncbi:MAG: hypothetical protein IPM63_05065 [Acidobacteriota bacterium]|nr:MAG: hypothetical protein IPM63_05065 [Acidobacteriota bacterium]
MEFARRHDLAIAKYLKDTPSWHFVFIHPQGGQGRIDVTRVDDDGIEVSAVWHRDDYDEGTRSVRDWKAHELTPQASLIHELREMLRRVVSWTDEDYETVTGFREMWQKYMTREDFEECKYPVPRLHD